MSAKLIRDDHDLSLLISLVEDLAQHTVEETEPIQERYSKKHHLSLPINGLGEVKLTYKVKDAKNKIPGYEQFEVSIDDRRVLFLRGETLRRAEVFDSDGFDSRARVILERYVRQNLD